MIELNPYDADGYHVLKVETHLHTLHSDGQDTVAAMFEACRSAGYAAVSLTDHNTNSGLGEAMRAAEQLELILVPGVEVTTFRGHAVVLGVDRVPEWRDLEVRGVDALAREVHAEGGIVCVAHAAALGSPACSGCAWDWPCASTSIDLWEVFSAPRPITDVAVELWRQVVQQGSYLAPVAAGDVHSVSAAARPRQATHVYARDRTADGVLEALRQRRVFASAGERLDFWLETSDGDRALVGSRAGPGKWLPRISSNASLVEISLSDGERCVYAERRDAKHTLQAITAPIWIDTSH